MSKLRHKGGFRTLWIWVILAFLFLILAWTGLILVATKNQPELIEINPQ